MDFISGIYYVFIFSSLVWSSFFLILFFSSRKQMHVERPAKNPEPLTIIVPCYNGASKLPGAIEQIMRTNFPRDLLEVLIVDDGSEDDTLKVARRLARKYRGVVRALTHQHGGKASAINYALPKAKGKYVAIVDDDSYPSKWSFLLLMGFFEREKGIGGVTSNIRVRHRGNFLQRIQDIEYSTIVWVRKLLQYIESIYVTPGPLSMYRRDVLIEVGGFDTKNITEDIEIAWRLLKYGYKVRVSLLSKVFTSAPRRLRAWWRQRVRWSAGGTQTLWKYKNHFMQLGSGALGAFIVPFFVLSYVISLTGFTVILYRILSEFAYKWYYTLLTGQSSAAQSFMNFFAHPNSFTFFGIFMLIVAIIYLSFALVTMGATHYFNFRRGGFFILAVYMTLYVTVMPIILLAGISRNIRGVYKW